MPINRSSGAFPESVLIHERMHRHEQEDSNEVGGKMNILLIGATGAIGSRILKEAVSRGHDVTAVARHISDLHSEPHVRAVQTDAKDTQQLIELATGQDAIVSSLSPRGDNGREQYLTAIRSVLAAAKATESPYVLFVGGMSNLYTANGRRILDQLLERMPAERLSEPIAVADARAIIEQSDVNWTFFCPGGRIEPGERTGEFRVGGEQALFELGEETHISMEDYAVAAIDELEQPQHLKQMFHACY
jgi:putative NADH-flavin reductase